MILLFYEISFYYIRKKKLKIITGLLKRMPGATGTWLKDRIESTPTPQTVTTETTGLKQLK